MKITLYGISSFLLSGGDVLDVGQTVKKAIEYYTTSFFEDALSFFATVLVNIMSVGINVLEMDLVQNGIKYTQLVALVLLGVKVMNEAFQTYILHQAGDPDADPGGLLIRTAQAVAVICCLPWIVSEIFKFGNQLALDVADLSSGSTTISDWIGFGSMLFLSGGFIAVLIGLGILILFLVVGLQAGIRGATIALMAVIGPFMALNLSTNNRSVWSAWFREIVIICVSQALQIYMIKGVFFLLLTKLMDVKDAGSVLIVFGWLWVTIKSPKFIKQFVYSTGLSNSIGGAGKQAGSAAITKLLMFK